MEALQGSSPKEQLMRNGGLLTLGDIEAALYIACWKGRSAEWLGSIREAALQGISPSKGSLRGLSKGVVQYGIDRVGGKLALFKHHSHGRCTSPGQAPLAFL